ncbi:hypothetical protein RHSIM_Rhsim12G0183600 [Rhododendron simsii]|uniref:Uncharacterized protein n=1 Tax=Rhododendron simsii TaxID=118357 RepID=A0A834L8S1_RHOSS|nr:hypothetical protein RHSIM_Rhsim12G0183600 [Rhododendron simsii]
MHINNIADLVFFQNGLLEPWFHSKGLRDADQVLAYFAISKLGEPPIDGKTATKPEGLTAAFGKWASAVAARLHAGGLSCKVKHEFCIIEVIKNPRLGSSNGCHVFYGSLRVSSNMVVLRSLTRMLFRSRCWSNLYGYRHSCKLGHVILEQLLVLLRRNFALSLRLDRTEISSFLVFSLIAELAAAAAAEKGIAFENGMVDRLCAYSRAVAHFPTAVVHCVEYLQFKWRNGWFYSLSEKTITEGKQDPYSLHTAWLKELKVV